MGEGQQLKGNGGGRWHHAFPDYLAKILKSLLNIKISSENQ